MLCVSTDSLWVRVSEAGALDVAFLVSCCALVVHSTFGRWFDRRPALESLRTHRLPLLGVGALASVSQLAFITAITETRVANVVAIVAAAPADGLAVRPTVSWASPSLGRVAVAITLTMVGIGVIVSSSVGEPTLRGDLLALAAVVCFAGKHDRLAAFPGPEPPGRAVPRRGHCRGRSRASRHRRSRSTRGPTWPSRPWDLCFNPLGRLANSNALRFAPVSEVSLFAPTETVAGTVWAALFLSELPGVSTVAGAIGGTGWRVLRHGRGRSFQALPAGSGRSNS